MNQVIKFNLQCRGQEALSRILMNGAMEANPGLPQQAGKRPRPVVSCLSCRRMKLKCNRQLPCDRCTRVGRAAICAYAPGQEPHDENGSDGGTNKRQRTDAPAPEPSSDVLLARFEELQSRVIQLEGVLQTQDSADSAAARPPAQSSQSGLQPRSSILPAAQHDLSDHSEVARVRRCSLISRVCINHQCSPHSKLTATVRRRQLICANA